MHVVLLRGAAVLTGALVSLGARSGAVTSWPAAQGEQRAQQQGQELGGDLRKEIEKLNNQMCAALRRGDLRAVARFYADDAEIRGPQVRVVGRAALDEFWTSMQGTKDWKLEVQDVGGSRESAWEIGRSTLTREHNGMRHDSVIDFVMIWKREPSGELKVHLEIYNYAD